MRKETQRSGSSFVIDSRLRLVNQLCPPFVSIVDMTDRPRRDDALRTLDPTDRAVLWTMRQHERRLTAEVVGVTASWTLELRADGALQLWYACPTREAAVRHAAQLCEAFTTDGWALERRVRPDRRVRARRNGHVEAPA